MSALLKSMMTRPQAKRIQGASRVQMISVKRTGLWIQQTSNKTLGLFRDRHILGELVDIIPNFPGRVFIENRVVSAASHTGIELLCLQKE